MGYSKNQVEGEQFTLAIYVDSAGIAPHNGGGLEFTDFPIYNGSVCAELSNIFINAPLLIVSLFPAFRAYKIENKIIVI